MYAIIKVLIISCIGGWIFSQLNVPIPWMLGPIVFVMLTQFIYKGLLKWPAPFLNIGVVIVGTVIGVQFNTSLFDQMGSLLLYMILVNVILIGGALLIAQGTSKWTGLPVKVAILGAIPGGLSQTVAFALEEKITDISTITYFQIIRLLLVVMIVPFIVSGDVVAASATGGALTFTLIALIVVSWCVSYVTNHFHLPVAFFITPIMFMLTLQLTTPIAMPPIPDYTMVIAQVLIGAHIGLMLKPHMLKFPKRVLVGGVVSALALILLTIGSSYLMMILMDTTFVSSFLSAAPGGLDQMVLLAEAIDADASLVSMFQTFRLLFIFLCIMPILKIAFRRKSVALQENTSIK